MMRLLLIFIKTLKVGTCRTRSDEASIVYPALKMRGVEGLKVVGVSVMSSLDDDCRESG